MFKIYLSLAKFHFYSISICRTAEFLHTRGVRGRWTEEEMKAVWQKQEGEANHVQTDKEIERGMRNNWKISLSNGPWVGLLVTWTAPLLLSTSLQWGNPAYPVSAFISQMPDRHMLMFYVYTWKKNWVNNLLWETAQSLDVTWKTTKLTEQTNK